MATDFDVVVLGSGFGGAITSCRLAEAGYKVLILERGRWWQPKDFPSGRSEATNYPRDQGDPWIWDQEAPEERNGWVDFRIFPNMTVVQGAGVGGGSLIYANVSVKAAPSSFDQGWPREIRYEELLPYYKMVEEMLDVQMVPENQLTERYKLVREAANAIGEKSRFRPLDLAISFDHDWTYDPINGEDPRQVKFSKRFTNKHGVKQGRCVHLGNCDIGCDAQAKNTLDLNYISKALRAGAEVRALHMARNIVPEGEGYRVHFDRIDIEARKLWPGSVTARIVIVARGSLGSTELLLRCRDEHKSLPKLSDFLGHNWSSNGDFLTPAIHAGRRVSPTHGPTISAAIDFVERPVNGEHFFIQDGGFPDMLGNWLRSNPDGARRGAIVNVFLNFVRESLRSGDTDNSLRDPFRGVMPWFAQGIDYGDGRLDLRRPWWLFGTKRLHLNWNITESERTIDAIVKMHERLARATGGMPLVPPTWTLLKDLITPHPLGGCNMSDHPGTGKTWTDARGREHRSDHGVVDHKGEVFGYKNLYVADGATVPEAIGRNPSRTIAALAERIARIITKERR